MEDARGHGRSLRVGLGPVHLLDYPLREVTHMSISDVLHALVDLAPWREESAKLHAHEAVTSHFAEPEPVPPAESGPVVTEPGVSS